MFRFPLSAYGVMHKLYHGLTGGFRVRQIMTIRDELGGGVTRLRYDTIYEQKDTRKFFECQDVLQTWDLGNFSIVSMAIAGTTGWWWWWVFFS